MGNSNRGRDEADELRRRALQIARERAAESPAAFAPRSPEDARKILHELEVHQIELEMQNEELRRAQAELEASRARYADLYELAPVAYFTLSEQGLVLEANLTAATQLGVARGALLGQPITRFILREDQDTYYHHRKELFATGEPQACDLRLQRQDGTFFWTHLSATVTREPDGAPVCRVATNEITDRKKHEEICQSLRQSEERFRILFEHAADCILVLEIVPGALPVIRDMNSATTRLLGYERDELLGQPVYFLDAAPNAPELTAARRQAILSGRELVFEARHRRKDGSICDVECSVAEIQIGTTTFAISLERDITARKRAEEALGRTQDALLRSQRMARVGSWMFDPVSLRIEWSNEMFWLVGLDPAAGPMSLDRNRELIHPDDRERFDAAAKNALTRSEPFDIELQILHSDGTFRHQRTWAEVDTIQDGRRVLVGTTQDVTERTRGEEERQQLLTQLLQAQKMEAIGQLAGGLAHDFNNLLGAMIMQLNMLRLEPDVSAGLLCQVVDELLESANRGSALIRQLLVFSGRRATTMVRLDANDLLRELMKLLARLMDERVTLALELCDDSLWIEADTSMIEQVVTNLCVNARDAMPTGGRLTVTTAPVVLDAEAVGRHAGTDPGRFVCLQVADTGCGIDAAVLDHLFEPFFTTKAQGKGTGLGLATVYGIVARHGGFVEVQSQVGKGSRFSVYLPSVSAAGAGAERRASVAARGGTESILVVEDEATVRRMAVRCLRKLGYRVTEAANGVDALKAWDQEGGSFDLLFTDMVMPEGLSGLELCLRLRQSKAGLRTIIASGYSAEIVDHESVARHDVRYLSKPYDVATLAATVRECLEREPAPIAGDPESPGPRSNVP